MRRNLPIVLAALLSLGALQFSLPASAQQSEEAQTTASATASPRPNWTFDPVRGVIEMASPAPYFVPGKSSPSVSAETAPTSKTYTGTGDMTVTIHLLSTLPKSAVLRCTGSFALQLSIEEKIGASLGFLISSGNTSSSESVDATIAEGIATCNFAIPYSWVVPPTTSTTTVTVEGIYGSIGIAAVQIGSNGAVVRTVRSTSLSLTGPAAIPTDGTVTTLTGSTVL